MRCDQCKHWQKRDEGGESIVLVPAVQLGTCLRAVPFWEASEWVGEEAEDAHDKEHPGEWRTVRALKPEYVGRKFFAQDGSDYQAIVLTAPDFFCAEFEPI